MEKTKVEYIKYLIGSARDSMWKNELAALYNEKFGEGKDKEEKAKATAHAIVKDQEYIKFLEEQLALCGSSE